MKIVDDEKIIDNDQLLEEVWSLTKLLNEFINKESVIQWFAARRLIRNSRKCDNCTKHFSLYRKKNVLDGFHWVCSTCRLSKSVRDDSILANSKLALDQFIIILYCWCQDVTLKDIAHEACVGEHGLIEWLLMFRSICAQNVHRNPTKIGGIDDTTGEPITVDISIPKSFDCQRKKYKLKSNQESVDNCLIFLGMERESSKYFITEIDDCQTATISNKFSEFILPGSNIVFDDWGPFKNIDQIHNGIYTHSIINDYSKNRSRNIDKLWIRALRKLELQRGTTKDLFSSYISEFIWKDRHQHVSTFSAFLICIINQYLLN